MEKPQSWIKSIVNILMITSIVLTITVPKAWFITVPFAVIFFTLAHLLETKSAESTQEKVEDSKSTDQVKQVSKELQKKKRTTNAKK